MLRNARKQFQKSDESAYSIVPSRMSSRLSTSTREGLSSDDDMSYRRLSFEDDLFTARVYKRSYRTPFIQRLFRRKVQIESDTATIIGPEKRISGSKSADTEEYLIDGDEADRQTVSPPRALIPSTDPGRWARDGEILYGNKTGRLEGFSCTATAAKDIWGSIPSKPETVDNVDDMDSGELKNVTNLSLKSRLSYWREQRALASSNFPDSPESDLDIVDMTLWVLKS